MSVLTLNFLSLVNLKSVTQAIQSESFVRDSKISICVEVSDLDNVVTREEDVELQSELVHEQVINADFQFPHIVKYVFSVDFDSTIIWSGRGMMPHQISEEIKAGGITLEDIAL